MMKFVNSDKLKAALTAKQLLDIDLSQLENLLHSRKIDVAFATKKFLAEAKVNEIDATKF